MRCRRCIGGWGGRGWTEPREGSPGPSSCRSPASATRNAVVKPSVGRLIRLAFLCLCTAIHSVSAPAQSIGHLPITSVNITDDGLSVLDSVQQTLRIRSWQSLEVQRTLKLPCFHVYDVALSADQTQLAIAGGNPGESAWVALYTWPAMDVIWSREFSSDVAYAIAFHPENKTLAVACHDASVVVLDIGSPEITTVLSGHSRPVTGLAFVPGQTPMLLSCSIDQTIRVWDVSAATVVRSLTNHTQTVTGLAVRPASGDTLPVVASGGEDKTVRFWQPGIGRLIRFKRLNSPVTAITWTTDGTAVLAGCRDGAVRMVNAETLNTDEFPIAAESWINAVAVHPGEPVALIADSDGKLTKLNLEAP